MSAAEMLQRLAFRALRARLSRQCASGYSPAPRAVIQITAQPWALPALPQGEEADALLREAEAALRHEWNFFGLSGVREEEIDWHRDPESGRIAPHRFGFGINHRDESLVGNIKMTWEKNRHHHLTVLAAAYSLTRDERYAAEVTTQLRSWIEANPYLRGVNWTHPLEPGIRLIAWVWCERLLRGSKHHADFFGDKHLFWDAVYQHQRFIVATYSKGSSANNHLIGELAGLYISSVAWPFFRDAYRWRAMSRRALAHELERQTFPSGLNREMAFSYHIFTLEFFLLCLVENARGAEDFSDDFQQRVRNMVEAMHALTDRGGNLPRYGDGDEGMALQIQAQEARRDAWLYHLGRSLVGADVPAPSEGKLAAALLGHPPAETPAPVRALRGSVGFEDAGLYALATHRDTPEELFVLADAGPHGFLSIAAHAHADALSFTLSARGVPLLVDVGTYAYHTEPKWRNYFRSTPAHNTLTIDGIEPSTAAGPFLWTHCARTTAHEWQPTDDGAVLEAEHDGYRKQRWTHRRRFELAGRRLTLTDTMTGRGEHDICLHFHFAPDCAVDLTEPGRLTARSNGVVLDIILPEGFTAQLLRGDDEGGWYSPRFAVKQATTTARATLRGRIPATWVTTLEVRYED